jgi:DNA-binding transcriptional MerR regulator
MTPALPEHYSTAQVARIACVTERQLQWWDEQGILSPIQVAHQRLYTPRQLFAALLFRELRERGFTLRIVARVWRSVERQNLELPDLTRGWLVTNGASVKLLGERETVLAFLEQRRTPIYALVSLDALAARMSEQIPRCTLRRGPGVAREMERAHGEVRKVREA